MPNILPKAAVLAVIAGGFSLTGDLGWIADRGLRVLDAADVASPTAPEEVQPAEAAVVAAPVVEPRLLPAAAPVAPPQPFPAAAPPQPPAESAPASAAAPPQRQAQAPAATMKPPSGGCAEVAWASLRPGDRVTVWLAGAGPRCLVLDVVDPIGGEALAYEAAAMSADGRPLAAATPPRRVVVGRPGEQPSIVKGGLLHLAPAGIAAAGESGRWLGPVEALIVLR